MKRILCIISGMNLGGAETFLMKLYRKLDKEFYQMDFCVNIKEEGVYDSEIIKMGGKIFHIPTKSENIKQFRRELINVIKMEKYDYVLRITSNAMGFWDLKIAKKAGAKVCVARSSNSNDAEGIKAKIAHKLGKILYSRYVDVKIAPSDLAAKYTFGKKAYENGDVEILHNALDLDVYKFDLEGRKKVRREFGILDSEILCGHIGRFSKQKNHEYLIDVFERVCQMHSNYKLLLVGTGELEEHIRRKCEYLGLNEKVIFAGTRSDIPEILSAMDVYVFPSFYEGMPNTIIEAQATGLPCIVADTITKFADITGDVEFLPITDLDIWANSVMNIRPILRRTKMELIKKKGYDINDTVKHFVEIIFG